MALPDYEERKAARVDRLRSRAARKRGEAGRRYSAAQQTLDIIPLGQPILVGHHSEKRHRRDIDRIHRNLGESFKLAKGADALEARANHAELGTAVSSDDPEAANKLRARLGQWEAHRERWKAINKAARLKNEAKRQAALSKLQLSRSELFTLGLHPTGAGFEVSNAGANVRRIQGRIAQWEREQARELPPEITIGTATLTETTDRLQVRFPDKPSPEIRSELKRAGFRWARSEGCWQRRPSYWARHEAERIAALTAQPAPNEIACSCGYRGPFLEGEEVHRGYTGWPVCPECKST